MVVKPHSKIERISTTLDNSVIMESEIKRLQKEYEVDDDVAEKAKELIDEGLDENEVIEIAEEL
jgi:hypothetical protein